MSRSVARAAGAAHLVAPTTGRSSGCRDGGYSRWLEAKNQAKRALGNCRLEVWDGAGSDMMPIYIPTMILVPPWRYGSYM